MVWFTLGPATVDQIPQAIEAGANGVRHALSYADFGYHVDMAHRVRDAASLTGRRVVSVADLPGTKQRLGDLEQGPIMAVAGDVLPIGILGSGERLTVQDRSFFSEVTEGSRLVVGDGGVTLEIEYVGRETAFMRVVDGGQIEPNRGLTIVGGCTPIDELSEKDHRFAVELGSVDCFDVVAASFVVGPGVMAQLADELGSDRPALMAKIETASGVDNIVDIVAVSDLVMAARGDLALAISWFRLFAALKKIAEASRDSGTPWLLATQLFEGLSEFGFPFRAEMTDLPAWMEFGAAGAMLSKETAFGARPLACIKAVKAAIEAPRCW